MGNGFSLTLAKYIYSNIFNYLETYNISIPPIYRIIILFTLGIFIGSFINVISIRIFDGRDWVRGRSECDNCHHQLSAIDLIPIFSYVINKGKCRYCRSPISPRHITSEIISGILFILSQGSIITMLVYSTLLLNTLTDYYNGQTITPSLYGTSTIVIIYNIIVNKDTQTTANTLILIAAFILIVAINIITKEKYIGFGDLDVLFLILAYSNIYITVLSLCIASMIGTILLLPKLITHKIKREQAIPFVPYLLIGFIISVGIGDKLWSILIY